MENIRGVHAVLIMDQAGWHKAGKLAVPGNITILNLPPHSPAAQPGRTLWAYLRSHDLSNRANESEQHLLDAGAQAWQQLTPDVLRSVCACPHHPLDLERWLVWVLAIFIVLDCTTSVFLTCGHLR